MDTITLITQEKLPLVVSVKAKVDLESIYDSVFFKSFLQYRQTT